MNIFIIKFTIISIISMGRIKLKVIFTQIQMFHTDCDYTEFVFCLVERFVTHLNCFLRCQMGHKHFC